MADLHLIIANKAYSSWSLRPWLAMTVNGLTFRETVIGLQQEKTEAQIKQFSPSGRVPVLFHGSVVIWDSLAILEYLTENFPDKPWWPKERSARAMARSISAEMHAGFQNLRQNMPMNVRKLLPGKGRAEGVGADIARIATIWRDARERFGKDGPFLFGAFSNADAMYAPVVTRFQTYGVSLDAVCKAYSDAVLALPAMKAWVEAAERESWVVEKYEDVT